MSSSITHDFIIPFYDRKVTVNVVTFNDPTFGLVRRDGSYGYEVKLLAEAKPSVIAHECFHIAMLLFNDIGERELHTADHNEPFAYLLAYLVDEVTKRFEWFTSEEYDKLRTEEEAKAFEELNSSGIY